MWNCPGYQIGTADPQVTHQDYLAQDRLEIAGAVQGPGLIFLASNTGCTSEQGCQRRIWVPKALCAPVSAARSGLLELAGWQSPLGRGQNLN